VTGIALLSWQNTEKHPPIPPIFLRALAAQQNALQSAASPHHHHARRYVFEVNLSPQRLWGEHDSFLELGIAMSECVNRREKYAIGEEKYANGREKYINGRGIYVFSFSIYVSLSSIYANGRGIYANQGEKKALAMLGFPVLAARGAGEKPLL